MGFSWKKFIQIAQVVGPTALTVAGVPPALNDLIVHGIVVAEEASAHSDTPMTGPEKKALALDAVKTGLTAINVASGKTVVDVTELAGVASDGIDTAVKAVKAAQNIPVLSSVNLTDAR